MEQIFIWIIVGVAWAVKAWWDKMQERLAKQEYDRREKETPSTAKTVAPAAAPAYDADKRYQDIQEEIRRRIAERMQRSTGSAPAAPPPAAPPPQPYRTSPKSTPPFGPQIPVPTAQRPKPAPKLAPVFTPVPLATPTYNSPLASPMAVNVATEAAYANAELPTAAEAYPSEAAAYSLAAETHVEIDALRSALATPGAAKRAFIMREIFDRPLCLRPVLSGGLEDWH